MQNRFRAEYVKIEILIMTIRNISPFWRRYEYAKKRRRMVGYAGKLNTGPWRLYTSRWRVYIYWYGENRLGRNYVACYRTKDLENWEFRGNVLHTACPSAPTYHTTSLSLTRPDGGKVNIERPKVIYCKETGKYVMWAHYENGKNYDCARACIATCDSPDGEFIYHGSFNPCGEMSRDCTLFTDDDGRVYFLSASNNNSDLNVYQLSRDCLSVDKKVNTLWKGSFREAPALFKKGGLYYLITSYCSGWEPNQGKYAIGTALDKPFSELKDFGDSTTFTSQPAFILEIPEKNATRYIYFGDRWCYKSLDLTVEGDDTLDYYRRSTYVVLPIQFDGDRPFIEYSDQCML